jgi:riboflavin synthase
MRETLDKTSLGALEPGSRVNLERSVTAQTRLGGHIVQGHVDATGSIVARTPSQHWELVEISLPSALAHYLVDKGSITVDGVSLTVAALDDEQGTFTVSLIPETLARTTLGLKGTGDPVNLEVDVIAKYVERLLEHDTKDAR